VGKLDVAKLYKDNAALKRIATMLEDAFNSVGERIRADLLKAYRENAMDSYADFIGKLDSGALSGEIYPRLGKFSEHKNWQDYATFNAKAAKQEYRHFRTWEELRPFVNFISASLKKADARANESYEGARDSFVYKNLGKLSKVIGKRQDLKNAVIKFDWQGGYFKGNLQVYLEGAYFRGDIDIKYVVRTIPNVTPYYQYPLVFVEAEVGGKHYQRPSEEELRVLLSGVSSKKYEEQKVAEAAAEGWCPMSGKDAGKSATKRYDHCPGCGAWTSIQHYKFRKHKTPAAEKAATASKLTESGYCPKSREKVSAATIATIGPVSGYGDPKVACEHCGQLTRLDAQKDWIFEGVPQGGHATKAIVKSARYYKHKLK